MKTAHPHPWHHPFLPTLLHSLCHHLAFYTFVFLICLVSVQLHFKKRQQLLEDRDFCLFCVLLYSQVLRQGKCSEHIYQMNSPKGPDPLGLDIELLHSGHQEFFCELFVMVTMMIIQPAVSMICFRDGNLHSQGKHNVLGIFLRKWNSRPERPQRGPPWPPPGLDLAQRAICPGQPWAPGGGERPSAGCRADNPWMFAYKTNSEKKKKNKQWNCPTLAWFITNSSTKGVHTK